MFTGIIENLGTVVGLEKEGTNIHFEIASTLTPELKIDQSVAHNGVCLTVVEIKGHSYKVTAINETLQKTCLSDLQLQQTVNLERCMISGGRFDGHMVYGHVDCVGECVSRIDQGGSTVFTFKFPKEAGLVVEKGSICLNGISLTVFNTMDELFSVAIIPYTLEHTNLKNILEGSNVNLEFDILGKYISKLTQK